MRELKPNPWLQKLQPLRIPAGWQIGWNTFYAMEVPADGFAGDSLVYLTRHDGRLVIDVEWRPEFDPNGYFNYYVQRQPLRSDETFDDERLDSGQSRDRDEVVAWLNTWLARGVADVPPQFDAPGSDAAPEQLHPLRVAGGWIIQRNAIKATPSMPPVTSPAGDALIFRAVEPQRRFRIDVTCRPDNSDETSYVLEVVYAPWLRTERGRRRVEVPLSFEGQIDVKYRSTTQVHAELVQRLEAWLWHASGWAVEGH